jgi:hypothetical protein
MAIAVVSIGGATLNDPYNYDSLWYRIPRMLHWLAEHRWHWVHTQEFRINSSATFSEWINLPILAIVPGYRALFLTNLITFLLLPGTFFSFLEALGVRRRVAWHWMWILPFGWVYAFQAGSLANDSLSAPLVMAAILYGCRAARKVPNALAWSLLAAALLSGAKILFVPLMLPWVICVAAGWKEPFRRPWAYLAVGSIACLASLVPLAVMSHHNTGSFLGTSDTARFIPEHPLFAVAANSLFALIINLVPPHTPGVSAWNRWMSELGVQAPFSEWIRGFECFGMISPGVDETSAGLGFPVTVLALLVVVSPSGLAKAVRFPNPLFVPALLIAFATVLSKVGPPQMNRYFAPYFPLLIAICLRSPACEWMIRKRWWQRAAALSGLATLILVMTARQHAFPVTADLVHWLHTRWPGIGAFAKANEAFQWRHQTLARFQVVLPKVAGESVIGCMLSGPGEHLFWRKGLRVHHVKPEDDPSRWRALAIRFIVVDSLTLGSQTYSDWATSRQLRVVERLPDTEPRRGFESPAYLMELMPPSPGS